MATKRKEKRKANRKAKKAAGGTKVGKALRKVKKGVKKLGKKAANVEATIVLAPFKGLMKKALKKKGHNPPKKMIDLVTMFYEIIVMKKEHLQLHLADAYEREMYEIQHADAGDDAPATKQKGSAVGTAIGAAAASNPISSIITGIVAAVLDFIKGLKKKRESGEKLTDTEDEILKDAETVSQTVTDVATDEAKFQIGDMITQYWWVLAAAVVLFIVAKK